jgi:hypothetical protein
MLNAIKLFSTFSLFFISSCNISLAQDSGTIVCRGRIVDENGEFIPYVNISLATDRSLGVYSGNSGKFEIKLPIIFSRDSLLFSCIGYEEKVMPIQQNSDSLTVILKEKSYQLPEIFIRSDSAKRIVEKSIMNLKSNLPKQRTILQGFFREIIRSDYTYDRLIEAAVDILDKGYEYSQEKDKGLIFKIRELRKSEDYMDLDWKASILNYLNPKNGLHGKDMDALFNHDYIRNNKQQFFELFNAPLNELFLSFADFSIDSLISFKQDTLVRIGIEPLNPSEDFLPYGHIYIRLSDYAIFEFEVQMNVNTEKAHMSFRVPEKKYLFRTIIKYTEYNGDMYLGMLKREAFRQQVNYTKSQNSKSKLGYFYDEKTFIVTEIITEKNKTTAFRRKDRQKADLDLYDENWIYNEAFWKNYNILHDNPLQPSILLDLERESVLNEQFKKNE